MEITIKDRFIGDENPTFIIAELSANHNQKYELAVKTIRAAKEAGADAIKLQTYTPDTITINCDNEYFQITQGTLWDGKSLYQLYKEAFTPWEWQPKLKKIAEDLGLIFFSTPFDKTAVDFLEDIDVPVYKIASFEITDIPLIEYVASKLRPVIISTGIATATDIREAIDACHRSGNQDIALLKCTSEYPTPLKDVHLKSISHLERKFKKIVGLSDHTRGFTVPIAAVALGAKIVEKHFILDRKLGGPDAKFSLEPKEFAMMVKAIMETEEALGNSRYSLTVEMKKSRKFSRSLFVIKDIKKGEGFSEQNIRSIRPGDGLHPRYYETILGKKALCDIKRGTPMKWKYVDNK